MKYPRCTEFYKEIRSLPVRGAWIEIADPAEIQRTGKSLPVRGAWIEIFDEIDNGISVMVAPRKGSVD